MDLRQRPPTGPRAAIGTTAEGAAASYLQAAGWTVLARNVRVGRDEVDIVALEPGPAGDFVVVEVRARSRPGFGDAVESVDAGKVSRLYRASLALRRDHQAHGTRVDRWRRRWRVDLLTLRLAADGRWRVERHLRGLEPP